MLNNIKSQYEKLEKQPSDILWGKLEQRLDQDNIPQNISKEEVLPHEKKWFRYAAAVVMLLTLGNVIWMLSPKQKEQTIIVKEIIKTETEAIKTSNVKEDVQPKNSSYNTLAEHKINTVNKVETVKTPLIPANAILENSVKMPVINSEIKKEDLLAIQPKTEKPEKAKYINASDLLFGAELDKTRKEQSSPNSKLGLNDIKRRQKDPNNFTPKSLKILGITVYESDSLTQK